MLVEASGGSSAGLVAFLALTLFVGSVRADAAMTTNRIYMHSKPSVVQIESGWEGTAQLRGEEVALARVGAGTGFVVHPDAYILTNAHVVQPTRQGDEAGREALTRALVQKVASNFNVSLEAAADWVRQQKPRWTSFRRINRVYFPGGASLPFEIKTYGDPTGEGQDLETGKDIAVIKVEMRNAPTLPLGSSAKVTVGDRIWLMGFPGAAQSRDLDPQSNFEVSASDGSITAGGKRTRDGVPVLQTNASATHGNSGGPVLNEEGEVIGLLTFRGESVNQQEVQGFSFIVPIDTAKEFIRQAGITEQSLGPVDVRWRDALSLYWAHRYKDAKEPLREIVELNDTHEEAKRLARASEEQIILGNDESGMGMTGYGLLLALLALAGIVVKRVRRSGGKAAPSRAQVTTPPQPPSPAAGREGRQDLAKPKPYAAGHQAGTRIYGAAQDEVPRPKGGTRLYGDQPVASISWIAGPLTGQDFVVGEGGVLIGREPHATQVVVRDPEISTVHAWTGVKGRALVFCDRGSTNGSFVNERLAEPHRDVELRDADVVSLGKRGNVRFVVRLH